MRINLKVHNGQYLVSENDEHGTVQATRFGVGPWETFSLRNLTRHDGTVRSGDALNLQTARGKFLTAVGGGGGQLIADSVDPGEWEEFLVDKLGGSHGNEVKHRDQVAFQASNRKYLTARRGGGGEVLAISDRPLEWETFTLEIWNCTLVHLKCRSGSYLGVEGGGGRGVRADREQPLTWETFALIGRSDRSDGFQDGDLVSLQVWDGHFIVAEGGGGGEVLANRHRAAEWETFKIEKKGGSGGEEIEHGDQVAFLASDNEHYLMASGGGGGDISASGGPAREWETFTLELAENNPTPFGSLSDDPTLDVVRTLLSKIIST